MSKNKNRYQKDEIAIIGMGCIFPGACNLKEYWHLLFNGIDAITDIPDDTHWKLKDYFDPDPSAADHTYCTRGGFIPTIGFDPLHYGMPPNNIEATDTSQLLGLEVARMALEDAGYPENHPDLEQKKVNVILGVTGTQELVIPLGARLGHPIWKKALKDSGIPIDKRKEIIQRIQGDYVQWQENSFPGLLGNVVAGRIANRLNLSGTNTVTDAACASSLSAIHTAVMELVAGKCDMSITGGVDALNDIFMHMCFSKTGVLSHTSDARPFSKDSDGTVLGEGVGMLVLKRLEDAQKDKDKIYAVIKGIGTSSDGRTSAIYAPDAKGQLKALNEAYASAGIDPLTVELLEAHGTGTRVGDRVEFDALKLCFKSSKKKNQTAIGSVKSMIGHTKACAGAAGMIKTALSLYNKVLPPTLKAIEPDPDLNINHSSFYLNSESKPWTSKSSGHPRRSGVSAFGFGGSNFHIVLEEYTAQKSHVSWDGSIQIIAFSCAAKKGLIDKISLFKKELDKTEDLQEKRQIIAWQSYESRQNFSVAHDFRLLIVHKKEDDIYQNLDHAIESIHKDSMADNIYFSSTPKKGNLGFLFPGQGSQYPGMGKDLVSVFPEALNALQKADEFFLENHTETGFKPLKEYIFPPPLHLQTKKRAEELLQKTDIAQPAIGAVSLAMINILKRFGIKPQICCGHSFGELSALYSAGWMDEDAFLSLAVARGSHMAAAGDKNKDSGTMLAVQAPIKVIESLIKEEKLDLVLANKNSRTQGVLSGSTSEIIRARKICRQKKIQAVKLPVAAAFHSKLVQDAVCAFKTDLSEISFSPTKIDIVSNTTGKPYINKEIQIRKTLEDQLTHPVNFLEDIEYMLDNDVSVFVEIGPKAVLTGLTRSISKNRNITNISLDQFSKKSSGIEDLAHALCQIASKGFTIDLTPWEDVEKKPIPKKMKVLLSGANIKPKNQCPIPKSTPDPLPQQNNKQNRSAVKGSDMTSKKKINENHAQPGLPAIEAMKMVQKGLEAMQQLQTQTAHVHEKFLETQAQASKTLASMMEQTRTLAGETFIKPQNSTALTIPEPKTDPASSYIFSPQDTDTVQAEKSYTQTKSFGNIEADQAEETENNDTIEPTEQILYEIVSRLTGFPVEMLEADMDIESDLGIDSIKKVEIISEIEKKLPSCDGLSTENISSVRTLKDIAIAIQKETSSSAMTTHKKGNDPDLITKDTDILDTRQNISALLVTTISELTGFPVEMLEPSMNLESDLGIDSIKRVEIFSKLEQKLNYSESISSDDIANMKTIEQIIAYLAINDQKNLSPPDTEPDKTVKSEQTKKHLTRRVVSMEEYPTNQIRFYNGAKIELPHGKKVYITKDNSNIARAFKTEFEKSGIDADLIDISQGNIPDLPDAGGLVLIPDSFKEKKFDFAIQFLKSAFLLAKNNAGYLMDAGSRKGAFFTIVSFLGGEFGFSEKLFHSSPVYGGLAGLAKTASLEWKNVLCRALDMPDSLEKCIENAEAAVSLMMTHGAVEMGLNGDYCNIPMLNDKKLSPGRADLGPDDVIVITGGAKGVTAACAIEIAHEYRPAIALIGRSDPPSSEPEWARDKNNPSELKKAILTHRFKTTTPKPSDIEKIYQQIISNREIKNNIRVMTEKGSRVQYFSADIRKYMEVEKIFQSIRKDLGPVTAIIHGAGVLEDKLIIDKQIDQFSRVLETKVMGLDALMMASNRDKLKYVVLFSSIAARTGNQGQCDYAVANEVLNKTARKLALQAPDTKFLSINWGPWEGGMVNASLKKEFQKRKIDLIPLQNGARQLVMEMGNSGKNNLEIIIGAHVLEKKIKEPKLSKAISFNLGLESTPVLSSHKIAGDPVVPLALLMEYHAHAAKKNNPGLVVAGMNNIRLLKGVKPGRKNMTIDVYLGKCRPGNNGYEIPSRIISENDKKQSFIHSGCTIILKDRLPKPPVLSKAAFMDLAPCPLTPEQAYADILFHGRALQGIKSIIGYSKKGIEVITRPAPAPEQWLKTPFCSNWSIEPMMMDAAFQAAILWSYQRTGQSCLPSFIANLILYSSSENLKGNIRILFTVNEESKTRIKGYFTFLDEKNTLIASITGFEAVTDPLLNKKFKPEPLFSKESILAFAQGNPSEAFGDKYKIFDKKKQIARLPKPPYFFMDRVLKADHPQWEIKPGGWIETQYDVPEDEWYFNANRSRSLPFCIMLEIALQPCGWLAAYAGSALTSDERLYFRNLGGKASLIKPLSNTCGTLTVMTRMTNVSKAGDMMIQDFDIKVLKNNDIVYKGITHFGFFTRQALASQLGIRNSKFNNYSLTGQDLANTKKFKFEKNIPLALPDKDYNDNDLPLKKLRMIDEIEHLSFDSGFYKKGYIKAIKKVDPMEWFFDAHFYQDPVCPGSLGIESFLQMIRFFLFKKFEIPIKEYEIQMTPDQSHEWIYRGQIIPANKKIEIHAHIKDVNHNNDTYLVLADGALMVDGICIYEMKNFSLYYNKILQSEQNLKESQIS